MHYMSLNRESRTGTVWCPGPLPNSLWVLDDETRAPVVVKVKSGKVENACETSKWSIARGHQALAGLYDPNPLWGDQYRAWRRDEHTGEHFVPNWARDHVARMFFRHAPALREKVWRAAVGDQCQLEIEAA